MKKIKFTCTNCHARLRVPTHLAGVSAPCPKCGATITAPTDITVAVDEEPASRRQVASPSAVQQRELATSGVATMERPAAAESSPSRYSVPAPVPLPSPAQAQAVEVPPVDAPVDPVPASVPVPAAVAELPVQVVPRPLQPRPITQPVPAEPAPQIESTPRMDSVPPVRTETAFFTPPPPVPAEAAPEMGADVRSDRPVEIAARPPVVVEVTTYPIPSPPPASAVTQPIQINPRPDVLPESRTISYDSPPLPRLDASLAAQPQGNAPTPLFREGSSQGMTRVQLPQPGVETHKFNPDDFIVPVSEAQPLQEAPAPQLPIEPELPVENPDVSEAEFRLPEPEALEEEYSGQEEISYLSIPLPNESAAIPLEDLAELGNDEVNAEDYYPERYEEPQVEEGEMPEFSYGESLEFSDAASPLSQPEWETQESFAPEGEFPHYENSHEAAIEDAGCAPSGEEEQQGVSEVSLHEGSFGKLFSQHAETPAPAVSETASVPIPIQRPVSSKPEFPLPQPIQREEVKSEGDVLDELFGSPAVDGNGKRRLSKLEVIMVSSIVVVAVIAVGIVFFLINLFGGLSTDSNEEIVKEMGKGSATTSVAVATPPVNAGEPSIGDAPAVIDPVAMIRDSNAGVESLEKEAPVEEAPSGEQPVISEPRALSFDERVQQVVNGEISASTGGSVIGSPSLDLVDEAIGQFNSPVSPPAVAATQEAPPAPPVQELAPPGPADSSPGLLETPASSGTPESRALEGAGAKASNYNPPAFFPAPGPNEGPLVRTNDVIDAFLRAPNWEKRLQYTYQGESLRPAIEDYYKKWPTNSMERFSLQLFQMEQGADLGGPYWVYLVSSNDMEQGFPLILRVEDGNLKVDWEIFSEFFDQHFVKFREGKIPSPGTFRLVLERVSDYYGTDRDAFTDLTDYQVYQVNTPYGDLDEFSEYAFVDKGTELAKKLNSTVGLGDEPLAVIITLDRKAFAHGVKHLEITEYITEGWFR